MKRKNIRISLECEDEETFVSSGTQQTLTGPDEVSYWEIVNEYSGNKDAFQQLLKTTGGREAKIIGPDEDVLKKRPCYGKALSQTQLKCYNALEDYIITSDII